MKKTPALSVSPKRADALDALRGLAILAMVLSGTLPFGGALPAWMYHAQLPPPDHTFNPNIPGLTWVDLVFPIFLFALGVSIPLSGSRAFSRGWNGWQMSLSILKRGFLLGTFAIFVQHVRPTQIDPLPGEEKWWLGLLGFGLLVLCYARWPKSWPLLLRRGLTVAGIIGAVRFLSVIRYPDGSGFSVERSDIILIILTNMAVFGAFIWLLTRDRPSIRLGLLAILLALRLSSTSPGWVAALWSASPIPWLFQFEYLKYLFIVVPGTTIGDLLVEWLQASQKREENFRWSSGRFIGISAIGILSIVCLLVGLQGRWVWQTTIVVTVLYTFGFILTKNPQEVTESLVGKLYRQSAFWLLLGLSLEPFQGGIKKDSATLSYFFTTLAASIVLLVVLSICFEVFYLQNKFKLIIENGKNPMLGYIGFGNLIWPILSLTGLYESIEEMSFTPWQKFGIALIYTLLLALLVKGFGQLKIFMRT
ncbi:DUF5009 domain-containing protein [Oscillatoriales cyanobacterium LEGE 11467]|uniref:DUF5009 domain-containing protein n=1 Tax=Zarconia navalis LEGE 11467 TaxID=1828826 RepID=A0A928Z8U6_9CYAN|nr:DUF5009 domain-containing protein [Zarconia navalis]MBE9041048.1 DUF5009 domain-containing protein [Zarconia navalis LEGE 11467]